eukprot:gene12645-2312_t
MSIDRAHYVVLASDSLPVGYAGGLSPSKQPIPADRFGGMSFLTNMFGKKKTPDEMMREYKRQIDRTIREIDRERVKMQQQEKTIMAEMKRNAKQNQMDSVKIQATDLVRTRKYVTKFYRMKAQLQAISLNLQ